MKLGRLRKKNFEELQTWAMVSMTNYRSLQDIAAHTAHAHAF